MMCPKIFRAGLVVLAASLVPRINTFCQFRAAESTSDILLRDADCRSPHSFGAAIGASGSGQLKDKREGDDGGGEEFHVWSWSGDSV